MDPGEVARAESGPVNIKKKRGDDLIGDIEPPTIVKIDVEGAEVNVIRGMKKALSSESCRLLYCEVHTGSQGGPSVEDFDGTVDELKELLKDCGFEISIFSNRNNEFHIKATKQVG